MGKASVAKVEQGQVYHSSGNVPGVKEVEQVDLSFDTGEQGAKKIRFPWSVTITEFRGIVTKALAATDAGTMTPSGPGGTMTGGTLTFAASAAIGNEQNGTPTANNVLTPNQELTLTPAKTTAGGKISVQVHYRRDA